MSTRAIRAIRGEASLLPVESQESSDDDEDDDDVAPSKSAFASIAFDDDDDSFNSSQEESEDNVKQSDLEKDNDSYNDLKQEQSVSDAESEEEDFDALISEFQLQDAKENSLPSAQSAVPKSPFQLILRDIDVRNMDIEWSLRVALREGAHETSAATTRQRRMLLFGPARDGWPRPPRHVGGGMGMKKYTDLDNKDIPWPYNAETSTNSSARWFQFTYSDTYQQECNDYETIQSSGDFHALVWFVIHHPYNCPALLQLSRVLYQTNHSSDGLAFLRRCLWVYESSALHSFTREHLNGNMGLMDAEQAENQTFFAAMFKLVQVAHVAGLYQTAFAVSRFILSLDPLRDPMGVLLSLDSFCLATNAATDAKWLIDLVDSNSLHIYYKVTAEEVISCELQCLPNWAFSYALAKFRLYQDDDESEELKLEANAALQDAIKKFPTIVLRLLQANGVDAMGRSFRRDWKTVLDSHRNHANQVVKLWNDASDAANLQAFNLVCKIFIKQHSQLWSSDDVLDFMYNNLVAVMEADPSSSMPLSPNAALRRYAAADPANYDNSFPQLPQEANIVDPGLIAHAMNVDPNRGRFLRRGRRDNANHEDELDMFAAGMAQRGMLGQFMQEIDPDFPLLEVFLRSFLPWNRVAGVPPP
ncbi:transcription factor 25 [Mayamaea pseudoterrestris]|nr:transcription factor 25 [Mayamaea pseudoterrestris]